MARATNHIAILNPALRLHGEIMVLRVAVSYEFSPGEISHLRVISISVDNETGVVGPTPIPLDGEIAKWVCDSADAATLVNIAESQIEDRAQSHTHDQT